MKTNTLLLSLLLLTATTSFSQTFTDKIVLSKGQKLSTSTTTSGTTSMEMMGQNMETVSESSGTTTIEVKDVTATGYKVTSTTNKLKIKTKMMGQEMNYDSDKKEDANSEIGKALGDKLKPVDEEITFSGKGLDKKGATEEESMQKAMESLNGSGDNGAAANFILIPAGKKAGDVWVDSSNANGLSVNNTYTLQKLNGNEATVIVNTVSKLNKNVTAQGADVTINMSVKSSTTDIVDVATGLVKEKKTTAEGTGNISAGGQEMPMTTKMTTVTTVKSM